MSERKDTTEMWELLKADLKVGSVAPQVKNNLLHVREVTTAVGVFQPRKLDGQIGMSDEHLKVLFKVLKDGRELDPILVWWSGVRWYVVDGHHRLLAYRHSKRSVIPVVVIEGSLEEMVTRAAMENSKDQLKMTLDDKCSMAWRLVVMTKQSKASISRACGVSDRTVGYMRKAKKQIEEQGHGEAMGNLRWWQVKKLLDGGDKEFTDPDEKLHADIEKLLKRIRKSFSGSLSKVPEVLAGALLRYDNGLPLALINSPQWGEHILCLMYSEDEDEPNGDFERFKELYQGEMSDPSDF